tara:strand:+ start:7217 stop:7570 length:354 start_codon:yes stop_codon:yes gene_type:complete
MEIKRRISDSTLLMLVMGLGQKTIYLNDSDVQRHEVHWEKKYPNGFEVMAEVVITCQIITPAGYIDDEGYQRPEPAEYVLKTEIDDVHLYFSDMPLSTEEQIENIVRPQLKNLINLL